VFSAEKMKQVKLVACGYAGHNFSYNTYMHACNLLSPLTKAEAEANNSIVQATKINRCNTNKVYVVAHVKGDQKTLQHEKYHAIFHYVEDYRKRVDGIWKMVEKGYEAWSKQFVKHLSDKYAPHVWIDEFQAIILSREYECVAKIVNLLETAVPDKEPFASIVIAAA
jgi:hypothetical protein